MNSRFLKSTPRHSQYKDKELYNQSRRFFLKKNTEPLIKIIFHADSVHFIHKSEESNATTAGGYSAKWLPTVTIEMGVGRGFIHNIHTHGCVSAGEQTYLMENNPKFKAFLNCSSDKLSHIQPIFFLKKVENTKKSSKKLSTAIHGLPAEIETIKMNNSDILIQIYLERGGGSYCKFTRGVPLPPLKPS